GSSPYQVTVTATAGTSSVSQSFVWTVSPRVALLDPGSQLSAVGDGVNLAVTASSPAGAVSYSAAGLPPGLRLNAGSGLISGTVAATADTASPYSVTVTASAGTSTASQSFAWNVDPRISVTAPGDQSSAAGDVVSLQVDASDASGGTLSYSAVGLPAGLSIA